MSGARAFVLVALCTEWLYYVSALRANLDLAQAQEDSIASGASAERCAGLKLFKDNDHFSCSDISVNSGWARITALGHQGACAESFAGDAEMFHWNEDGRLVEGASHVRGQTVRVEQRFPCLIDEASGRCVADERDCDGFTLWDKVAQMQAEHDGKKAILSADDKCNDPEFNPEVRTKKTVPLMSVPGQRDSPKVCKETRNCFKHCEAMVKSFGKHRGCLYRYRESMAGDVFLSDEEFVGYCTQRPRAVRKAEQQRRANNANMKAEAQASSDKERVRKLPNCEQTGHALRQKRQQMYQTRANKTQAGPIFGCDPDLVICKCSNGKKCKLNGVDVRKGTAHSWVCNGPLM